MLGMKPEGGTKVLLQVQRCKRQSKYESILRTVFLVINKALHTVKSFLSMTTKVQWQTQVLQRNVSIV